MKYLIAFLVLGSLPLHAEGGTFCWATCIYKVAGQADYQTHQITAGLDNICASFDKMQSTCADGKLESKLVVARDLTKPATMENSCGFTREQLDAQFGQP